jgi:hypothetical protein
MRDPFVATWIAGLAAVAVIAWAIAWDDVKAPINPGIACKRACDGYGDHVRVCDVANGSVTHIECVNR